MKIINYSAHSIKEVLLYVLLMVVLVVNVWLWVLLNMSLNSIDTHHEQSHEDIVQTQEIAHCLALEFIERQPDPDRLNDCLIHGADIEVR